jgi:hypothetical protein
VSSAIERCALQIVHIEQTERPCAVFSNARPCIFACEWVSSRLMIAPLGDLHLGFDEYPKIEIFIKSSEFLIVRSVIEHTFQISSRFK